MPQSLRFQMTMIAFNARRLAGNCVELLPFYYILLHVV